MDIFMKKFGDVLTSRQSGREAYAAFTPALSKAADDENVIVDFDGVNTFSPSWGDEFLTPLQKRFGGRLTLKNTSNPSVKLTVEMLEKVNGVRFRVSE
jgi:hypothetical protein